MERVAVVIPNRNGAGFLGTCVEAASRAGAAEIVVVDDGSSDDSPAEAAAAGARVVRSPGRGFAAAVAHGFAETEAPFVLLLNSDCFLDDDAIRALAAAASSDARLGLVGAGLRAPDGSPAKSHGPLLGLNDAIRALLTGRSGRSVDRGVTGLQDVEFVPLACALARRSAWDAVGGIDVRYGFYFEDYDLCWLLGRASWRIAVCWDAGAVHVGGASSTGSAGGPSLPLYYAGLARYLRKRYPRRWVAFSAVWLPYALLQTARAPRRRNDFLGSIRSVLLPPR